MSNPKRQRQRRLEREQLTIERRLGAAVAPNLAGPLLQAAPIRYEWAERDRGVAHGGMGMIARLVEAVGLAGEIDAAVKLLKVHRPYHESDHVLNIAYTHCAAAPAWRTSRLAEPTRCSWTASGRRRCPTPPPLATSAAASTRPRSWPSRRRSTGPG